MPVDEQPSRADPGSRPASANQVSTDTVTLAPYDTDLDRPACPRCGQMYRPGVLACPRCGIIFQDRLKTREREEPELPLPTCYNCGKPHAAGAVACPACWIVFSASFDLSSQVDIKDFTPMLEPMSTSSRNVGSLPETMTTIILEVDGVHLLVPPAETVIVGRFSSSGHEQPTLDLSRFGAHEKGVSRRHVRIWRRGTLVYVADIGSTNGTWLNGQRLMVNGECLLRDGDELRLSHLTLRVKYISGGGTVESAVPQD